MKKYIYVFLFFFVIVSFCKAEWTLSNSGFKAGEITCIYQIKDTLIVGTANRGLFISTNAGTDWTNADIMLQGVPILSIESIAKLGSSYYIGTKGSGLFKSDDYGSTWEQINSDFKTADIYSQFLANDTLYICASYRILMTTDNGATWRIVIKGTTMNSLTYSLKKLDNFILVACSDGVKVSTDNGVQWNLTTTGLENQAVYDVAISDNSFFAATDKGVYRSNDLGNTWEYTMQELKDRPFHNLMVVDDKIIAVSPGYGVYYSSNNGMQWVEANSNLQDKALKSAYHSKEGFCVGTNSSKLFRKKVITDDWIEITTNFNIEKILCMGAANGIAYVGTQDHGILQSETLENWIQIDDNNIKSLSITAIASDNISKIYAGTRNNGIYVSADNGLTWTHDEFSGTRSISSLFVFGNIVIAGCKEDELLISSNSGDSWTKLSTGAANNVITGIAVTPTNIYLSSQAGIFASPLNLSNWTCKTSSLPGIEFTSIVVVEGVIYAGTTSNGIYISTDYGDNWFASNEGINLGKNYWITSLIGYQKSAIAAANGGGIYATVDNGSNWKLINSDMNETGLVSLTIFGESICVGAKTGVYYSPLEGLISAVEDEANSNLNCVVYPNPASDNIYVKYDILGNEQTIEIVDLLGSVVTKQSAKAGNNVVFIGNLNSGVYLIRIGNYSSLFVKE